MRPLRVPLSVMERGTYETAVGNGRLEAPLGLQCLAVAKRLQASIPQSSSEPLARLSIDYTL